MSSFPMCINLTGKPVFLVGSGPQIREKAEKLRPFGPQLIPKDDITAADLQEAPALVVAGDLEEREAERISALCREHRIPVNVVDRPELCSFFFPALICRGDLTVSVSTGGSSPGLAACLGRRIAEQLPDRTEEILDWLGENRRVFREMGILKTVTEAALDLGRPLTEEEILSLK